ncbi:MAG: hypothetical protein ACLS4A_09360 [Oscillospiraceae bacterium]
MDYSLLAGQLLNVQANLLQVPAYQQLSKMVRGELFVLNYLATHETAIHPKELSKRWPSAPPASPLFCITWRKRD